MSNQLIMTLSLFLIGMLHAMIFAVFQIPDNFLLGRDSMNLALISKGILYTCAIVVSLSHEYLSRTIGLRKTLYCGMIFNLLGLGTLLVNQLLGNVGWMPLILLNMFFFGIALTSVINSLVTYVVLEFPRHIGFGIVALFAFLNLGNMLAPIMVNAFQGIQEFFYPVLIILIGISLWFIHISFFDPLLPAHLVAMKKGTLLWKEMHYRLALFVVAIITYALTETTFSLWGFIHVKNLFGLAVANETIPLFWLFMVIGQMLVLLPLYYYPAQKIFYLLILVVIGAAFAFPEQTNLGGIITTLIVAGIGCSAIFPILLSMMEREIFPLAHGSLLLHYIEISISVMLAGYFVGVGAVDIWVQKLGEHPFFLLPTKFHMSAIFIGATGLIALFLHLTSPHHK